VKSTSAARAFAPSLPPLRKAVFVTPPPGTGLSVVDRVSLVVLLAGHVELGERSEAGVLFGRQMTLKPWPVHFPASGASGPSGPATSANR
jgi:hypothetical protein